MNVLAGAKTDLRWCGEGQAFKPKADVAEGPVFTIQTLDYFTAQGVLSEAEDADKVRLCITAGLISIDGDAKQAEAFKEAPRAPLVNPLFNKIWVATWGNFEAPEASE